MSRESPPRSNAIARLWTLLFMFSRCLAAAADPGRQAIPPALERPAGVRYDLGGPVGRHVRAVQENWLVHAPRTNPAMLQMFADRDKQPDHNLLPGPASSRENT